MRKTTSTAILLGCLLVGDRQTADATDEKWTGADACIGETSSDTGFQIGISDGVMHSLSSSARVFQCPIVRDYTATTTGLFGASLCYDASHSPTTATVSCSLCSYDLGSYYVECTTKSATGGDTGCLTWDSDDVDLTEDPGYYGLRCEVTGVAGKLISYRWIENET